MSERARTIVLTRWRAWAAALARRRRRLGGRFAAAAAVLARPRLASGRTVREQRLRVIAPRTFVSNVSNVSNLNLSIHPLLRFDLRPATAVHRTLHAIHLAIRPLLRSELWRETNTVHRSAESIETIERFRQSVSSATAVLETAPPRIAPLSLVLQRLRVISRGERREGGAPGKESIARRLAAKVRREEKPIGAPSVRVLRQDAAAARSDRDSMRDSSGFSISAAQRGPAAFERSAPDSWHETRTSAAVPAVSAAAVLSPAGVEALTEKVMQQIDRRLHVWRERRGGF